MLGVGFITERHNGDIYAPLGQIGPTFGTHSDVISRIDSPFFGTTGVEWLMIGIGYREMAEGTLVDFQMANHHFVLKNDITDALYISAGVGFS
jgi:hypothetical protein